MKVLLLNFAACATAFPFVASSLGGSASVETRGSGETNCGPTACVTFNAAEQYVDITPGSGHEFVAPKTSDRRGPCPGLNAAANHGFIPHNGILTTTQTITGLAQAYGMGADIAAGLAVIAILLEGDPIAGTWSIGGAYPGSILDTLGEQPQGISYSHNNYEGDSSVTRADAYLNKGDASSLIMSKFEALYNSAELYTLDSLRSMLATNQQDSISTNAYYFSGQFSGLLVVPAAHHFIINFFSNHSAAQPNGYLDRNSLKSFFGISGSGPGHFIHTPGAEKIPPNWYRRPSSNPYDLTRALADVAALYAANPSTFKFGGNTGGVNTFTGIDVGNLTGGLYNSQNLLQGNNLGCFVLLAQQENFPDILKGLEGDLAPVTQLLANYFAPMLKKLECPVLEQYNQGLFNQFPGYKYDPKSPSKR